MYALNMCIQFIFMHIDLQFFLKHTVGIDYEIFLMENTLHIESSIFKVKIIQKL